MLKALQTSALPNAAIAWTDTHLDVKGTRQGYPRAPASRTSKQVYLLLLENLGEGMV